MKRILLTAAAVMALASPAPAGGPIERACKKLDRKAATSSTCRCVQKIANSQLSRKDQRKAAKFFKDPHKAQELRQSSNSASEAFWLRYKEFGNLAARHCS